MLCVLCACDAGRPSHHHTGMVRCGKHRLLVVLGLPKNPLKIASACKSKTKNRIQQFSFLDRGRKG